jgi:serine/threonine protein kinase
LKDDTDVDAFGTEPTCRLAVAKALGSLAASHERGSDSRPEFVPDKIGEYEIVRRIGRGGMSSVYLARHAELGREVAVKVLSSHRLAEPRTLERFNTEMRMVGSLTHPNIVTAFDAREVDGVAVLVTEFIDGFDAGEIARRVGVLSVADSCTIGIAICRALNYVNAQGMVHRDIKPSNVMISRNGDIKLLDLGLARFHDPERASDDVTGTGQAMVALSSACSLATSKLLHQWCGDRKGDLACDTLTLAEPVPLLCYLCVALALPVFESARR